MVEEIEKQISQFGGVSNAEDEKQTPANFFRNAINYNFPDDGIIGMNKILMPKQIIQYSTHSIDGVFEYRFKDLNGTLQVQNIITSNGDIVKTDLSTTNTVLKTGLTVGLSSFAVYQDNLFIANGKNNIQVYYGAYGLVSDMGAPLAVLTATGGNVDVGKHKYAMTYITAGGEEVIGSISNEIEVVTSGKQITLHLPIGYAGTLTRNIYRTLAGGSVYYRLTTGSPTINDNTTLTYTDNIADATIGASGFNHVIPTVNNRLPLCYHLTIANQCLYATKTDLYPTQVFKTGTSNQVIDLANYIEVANYGLDNTACNGIGFDFTNVAVGTGKNWYQLKTNATDATITDVIPTRINVGCKSGYAVKNLPASAGFPGGLMFVSSLNDVRVMSGFDTLEIPTTLSNIRSLNWAQNIRGDLNNVLRTATNIYSEFFENKYHLIIEGIKYVFDIRTLGWTYHSIKTASYTSVPKVLGLLGSKLYNGQGDGWVEQEYSDIQYRGEDVTATIESPSIEVSRLYKWASKFVLWFKASSTSAMNIGVTLDDNSTNPISGNFTISSPFFNSTYFNPTYFSAGQSIMDYKVVNIARPCRWLKYVLINTSGNVSFKAYDIVGYPVTNKEG